MGTTLLRRVVVALAMTWLPILAATLAPEAASAAFPGLNGKIAYSHQVDQSSAAIYAVSPGGGTPTNLSAVGAGSGMTADFQPAWSATGKQLAFVRVDLANCSGQIWTMRADGTHQSNLSHDAAVANEFNPAYGPDGSIVFVRAAPHTFNICTMTPANQGDLWVRSPNGTTHPLTTSGKDNTPAWSPDGSRIAFTRNTQSGPHIVIINANGTGTPKDLGPGVKPNWSPNGSKIVFAVPGGPNGPTGGPVTVMNANGSNRKTLNANGTAPAYSPDGREITYITFDQTSNNTRIGVMSANGNNQHTITNPGTDNNDVKPDWQPILKRLRLSVTPRTAVAGQRSCFFFRVTSNGQAVAGARVSFAKHQALSSKQGRAEICATLSPGRHTATASKPGYSIAAAIVHAVKPPPFTG
jgi:TolB protein